jgi:hypothetical protein
VANLCFVDFLIIFNLADLWNKYKQTKKVINNEKQKQKKQKQNKKTKKQKNKKKGERDIPS